MYKNVRIILCQWIIEALYAKNLYCEEDLNIVKPLLL